MHGRESADPYMLKNAQDGQLALLVDESVVREDREIDLQVR
jgi:hypothetical protein